MGPDERGRRAANAPAEPLSTQPALIVNHPGDNHGDPGGVRCRECDHRLTADRSVSVGIGPVCARALRLQAVAA
jgi:uncharacterized protein DUF6011